MADCVVCSAEVRQRQEAIQCDSCDRWQHRICNSGISRQDYRQLVRGEIDLPFSCLECRNPIGATDNSTDDIPADDVEMPVNHLEDSIDEALPVAETDMEVDDNVTFTVIANGTQRGKPLLTDSRGFSYTVKRVRGRITYWWCSVRSHKDTRCPSTVIEKDGKYTIGKVPHTHDGKPGIGTALELISEVKESARENFSTSAREIVEKALNQIDVSAPTHCRPKQSTLIRTANRAREALRPKDPRDLEFEINQAFLPEEFIVGNLQNDSERHIVMATPQQLQLLASSKVWYLDGTFKVVREPFYQLFSIHVFIRAADHIKQIPVAFVLMSRRRTSDYKMVLQHLLTLIPGAPAVQKLVLDFEVGMWKACRHVMRGKELQGCCFHWRQAVYRKATTLALQGPYRQKGNIHKFVKELMALAYLPEDRILHVFNRLKAAATVTSLQDLCHYIEKRWIQSDIWPPATWSVFGQATRTNNDVEGWHRRLNDKAGEHSLGFYVLVPLLHTEASTIPLQRVLVSEGKLCRIQKKKVRSTQKQLFDLWESYSRKEISASALLRSCALL